MPASFVKGLAEDATHSCAEDRPPRMDKEDVPGLGPRYDDPYDRHAHLRAGEIDGHDLREAVTLEPVEQARDVFVDAPVLVGPDGGEWPELAPSVDLVRIESNGRPHDAGEVLPTPLDVPDPALCGLGQGSGRGHPGIGMGPGSAVDQMATVGPGLDDGAIQRRDADGGGGVPQVHQQPGTTQLVDEDLCLLRKAGQVDQGEAVDRHERL